MSTVETSNEMLEIAKSNVSPVVELYREASRGNMNIQEEEEFLKLLDEDIDSGVCVPIHQEVFDRAEDIKLKAAIVRGDASESISIPKDLSLEEKKEFLSNIFRKNIKN